MTRGFDDELQLFLKQKYVTMTKTTGDTKVKYTSLILKISFLTLFGLTLYLNTESK